MTLEQQLADAREAYHNLMTGRSARVFVDQNGERIEYTAARKNDLAAYILQLEAAVKGKNVHSGGPLRMVL